MGTVFVEAAASGLAVIGTDVGGVREMMIPGVTGLLVPPKDTAALRLAIQTLIDHPDVRLRMGQIGSERIWQDGIFTTERLGQRTEEIYNKWLSDLGHTANMSQPAS